MISALARASLVLGAVTMAWWLPALVVPASMRAWCRKFPRSVVAAWFLIAVDLAWATWLLYRTPLLSSVPMVRTIAMVVVPASFVPIVIFLDELLAARALGGLLMLVPRPLIDAAFLHDSPWRVVITISAYLIVIAGIVLMLSPYWFRKSMEVALKTDARSRAFGAAGVIAGLAIVFLGLIVL